MPEPISYMDRADDHERRISALENGQAALEQGQVRLEQKMAEYNGENRSRAETQERAFQGGFRLLSEKIDATSDLVSRLGSVRGWAGWAIVTATSAGVASIVSHFWMHQ
ncbi:MAG: hypothetical protein ACTIDN_04970 [Acetobacter sp.]|uniref:hypothetical protein n=1 Tax=Acetobacter sp. TaxID=440 RepID=UPI003F906873